MDAVKNISPTSCAHLYDDVLHDFIMNPEQMFASKEEDDDERQAVVSLLSTIKSQIMQEIELKSQKILGKKFWNSPIYFALTLGITALLKEIPIKTYDKEQYLKNL